MAYVKSSRPAAPPHEVIAHGAALAAVVVAAAALCGGAAAQAPEPNAGAQIELQIGVCESPEAVVRALAATQDGAPREVWFFDTSALVLYERGVRLRLRVERGRGELTLKVANQDCARVAPDLVPGGEGKCEYDRHGERIAGAVSLERKIDVKTTRRLAKGTESVARALSPAQVRYLREIVGAWPLPADVRALGPAALRRYRTPDRRYDVDVLTLPPGGGHVEVSRKVLLADGERAHVEMQADLARAGVPACAEQAAQSMNTLRTLAAQR